MKDWRLRDRTPREALRDRLKQRFKMDRSQSIAGSFSECKRLICRNISS